MFTPPLHTTVRTADLQVINKYIKYLFSLAACSVILRVVWVFDVISQVQYAVKKSQETYDPASPDSKPPLNDKVIFTFGVQASLVAGVVVLAWLNCLIRAIRLRSAVAHYESFHPNNNNNNNNNLNNNNA